MFKFNKEEHYYELDGKRLYGVTTVLGVIAKPALIPWAVKMATDYIESHVVTGHYNLITKVGSIEFDMAFNDLIKEAKSAHRKKKESAGEIGTDSHSLIEDYVKECLRRNEGIALAHSVNENQMVSNFVQWAMDNEVRFLASEKQLYSESMWCAGTTDLVLEMKGKKYIGDVKTSSAIYPEHFYQMAGYRAMLEEMGETGFDGSVVIRIGKDGKFNEDKDVQYRYDYKTDLEAFLGALAIFKAGETYKVK